MSATAHVNPQQTCQPTATCKSESTSTTTPRQLRDTWFLIGAGDRQQAGKAARVSAVPRTHMVPARGGQ